MLVLITYDVNTQTAQGRKRLRQVAKQCINYGQRVQNSVFECVLDASQLAMVKHKLKQIIDPELKLAVYNLGNSTIPGWNILGVKPGVDVEGC